MALSPADFGLTRPEGGFLRRLKPAWRIQRFLDTIDYDVKGQGCRSPRRVLRERTAQCMDGALFAAATLRLQGHGGPVELLGPALPGADPPNDPRPGDELRRVVLKPAPAEDAARMFEAGLVGRAT